MKLELKSNKFFQDYIPIHNNQSNFNFLRRVIQINSSPWKITLLKNSKIMSGLTLQLLCKFFIQIQVSLVTHKQYHSFTHFFYFMESFPQFQQVKTISNLNLIHHQINQKFFFEISILKITIFNHFKFSSENLCL